MTDKTVLESLPNELLLEIFYHLHRFDLLYAFSNLNNRFTHMIDRYLYNIDLSDNCPTSYRQFRLFRNHLAPLYERKLRSLKLVGLQQIQSLLCNIPRMRNLESLDISGIEIDNHFKTVILRIFLTAALSLPRLRYLSIEETPKSVLQIISSSRATHTLTEVKLIYPRATGLSNIDNISKIHNITHFAANFGSITILVQLLNKLPNLQELKAYMVNFDKPGFFGKIKIPKNLHTLWIEFGCHHCCTKFRRLKMFLNIFRSYIRSLTLISVNVEEDFSNYDKFYSLVNDFTQLETFQYCIGTVHYSDSLLRFEHVEKQLDSRYLFYNRSKLQILDPISETIRGGQTFGHHLTLSELFSCYVLWYCDQRIPTTFQLTDDLKFVNLRQISICFEFEDEDEETRFHQYLSKLISLSPNLTWLTLHTDGYSKEIINIMQRIIPVQRRKQITCLEMKLCCDNENHYFHSTFLSELSENCPSLKTLRLNLEWREQNDNFSIIELINNLRKYFGKLIHLWIGTWISRDKSPLRNGCLDYEDEIESMKLDSLDYTLEYHWEHRHYLNIWL
ncbi:hypothetical protein I4U23_013031 [Adineta vaga]|nr:hypothetical protein I4U23_013031 [Adineta vaga]